MERDDDGHAVAFHVEREPEWDDQQIALLLALREKQTREEIDGERGGHGVLMSEATSRWADPNNPYGWHYEARVRIDHAARAIATAQKERREKFPDEDTSSLIWLAVRVEDRPVPID